MIPGTNLHQALNEIRLKNEKKQLEKIKALLSQVEETECSAQKALVSNKHPNNLLAIQSSVFSENDIYTLEHIRELCVNYRLRFLDSKFFKGEVPHAAIAKMSRLEMKLGHTLSGLKILAPASLFKLELQDRDPMLFVPLSDGRFALIHQWGKDMSFFRKWMVYPFRSFTHTFGTMVLLAFLLAFVFIPDSVILGPYDQNSFGLRGIFFFYMILAMAGLGSLYGFSRMKNFNNVLWNSRYDD